MITISRSFLAVFTLLGMVAGAAAQEVIPTTYDLTNGDVYHDDSYTGGTGSATTDGSPLAGGKGQLIDGKTGVDNYTADLGQGAGYEWVGWDTIRPVITFHFAASAAFTTVALHSTSFGNVLYGAVQVEISDDGAFPAATTTVTNFYPTYEQRTAGTAGYLIVPVSGTGKHVRLTLDDGLSTSVFLSEVKFNVTGAAATPVVALAGGGTSTQTSPIALSSTTAGAELRYTTDGSDPTATSTLYSAPFRLSAAATVKARAFKTGLATSAPASLAVTTGVKGSVVREYFASDDFTLAALAASPEYPDRPARREFINSMSSAPNLDYYGTRMRGYIYPPVTGSYTFRLQSDGQGAIYLSTDQNPAHATQIAMEPNFGTTQVSNPVTLQAGQAYYIEATQSDTTGNDYLIVGWDIPDDPNTPANDPVSELPIPGSRLAPYDILTPRLMPDGGTFAAATTVKLAEPAAPGVTITYTTNGSDPTSASTAFPAAGLSVSANTTLKVRAQNTAGSVVSGIATAIYRIDAAAPVNHEAMELWLRADVGISSSSNLVDQWLDQSGRGRHGRQTTSGNRPGFAATGLHGQPAVTFNGSTQSLSLPAGFDDFSQGLTAIVVAQPVGAQSYGRFFDFGLGQNFHNIFFSRYSTGPDLDYSTYDGGSLFALNTVPPSATQIFEVVQETSERTSIYRGGALVARDRVGLPFNTLRTRNFIGRSNFNGDALFGGQISEMMIFRRALPDSERTAIESYLATRYTPDAVVAMPTISPAGGAFSGGATPLITLNSATSGVEIHYTLDGTDPTATSPLYSAPFSITAGATLKVKAIKSGLIDSRVAQANFDLAPATFGYALAEYFNSPERALGDLTNAGSFPTQPFVREYLDGLASNPGYANYGTRMRAYIRPPITGSYRFRMNSDDNGALFLSIDDNPAHKTQIAFEPTASAVDDYRQISAPVSLVAGQKYYLEALQAGVGGPNELKIGWEIPDDPSTTTVNENVVEAPIAANRLTVYTDTDTVGQLSPIGLSPATGVFASAITATLNAVVPSGATVRYTTNGTDPTTTSTAFPAGGLGVSADTTVKTKVFQTGQTASATVTTTYKIDSTSTFTRTGLQMWLRADTGVEPAGSGVALWRDLSGHNNHAMQEQSARQPQVTASSINGRPAVTFDGVGDVMTTSANLFVGRPSTVIMVYKKNSGTQGRLLHSDGGHNWLLGPYFDAGGFYADGWVRQNQNIPIGSPFVAEALMQTTSSRYFSNGQDYTDDSTPVGVVGRLSLGGALGFDNQPDSGDIAELMVFDHSLTDGERLDVEKYLATRYATFSPQVAEPLVAPPSGKETATFNATITSVTPSAEIRYTLDGSTPTQTSTLYSGPISINATKTLKARAFKTGYNASVVAETRYDFTTPSVIPLANLQLWLKADGPMSKADNGRIQRWGDISGQGHDATMAEGERQPVFQDTQIGTLPVVHMDDTAQGLRVDAALDITQPATIFLVSRVRSGGSGQRVLQARNHNWLLGPYTNIIGFYAEGWVSPTNIALTTDVPHLTTAVQEPTRAAFYLEGANMTANPYPNQAPDQLVIGGPGQNTGYANADVAEVIVYNAVLNSADRYAVEQYLASRYGIATSVATPDIAPGGGLFNGSTSAISITDATPGATIRYTTDGTDPTSSSPIYTAPFMLAQTGSVRAKAFKSGLTDSTIAVATYTVNSPSQGGIARQLYHGGNGNVTSLYASADYPNNPFVSDIISSFSSAPNLDSYSTRLRGYIYPPTTGAYTFKLNADDTAKVFLSTDEAPANAVQILSETSAATLNDYRQVSAPITLTAGKRYYIEAVHSEGGGADFVQVAWVLPDSSVETPIPGSRLSPYGESDVPNQLPAIALSPNGGIFSGPVSVTVGSPIPQGASVYYTTNGTDPTTSSTLYSGAFTVSANATVKARMFRSGSGPSAISSAVFAFDTQTTFTRNNLALWYRADDGEQLDSGGRVLRLADQSGNARDAVQSDSVKRPLYASTAFGSHGGLRFDGTDDTLSTGYFVQHGPRTLVYLVHFLSLTGSNGYSLLGVEGGSKTYLGIRNDGLPYYGAGGQEGTYSSIALTTSSTYIMSLVIDGAGTANAYINNQLIATLPYYSDADANVPFSLGSLNGNDVINGDVPEVLLFQSALSDTEREGVENYIATRYGAFRTVSAPLMSPEGGTFAGSTSVTLTATSPGATIRYTTDGSDPTASSTAYTAPFNVTTAQTVKAKAFVSTRASTTTSGTFSFDAAANITHSGLQLWLRADKGVTATAGAVSLWQDQSGQGNDATQTSTSAQPTLDLNSTNALPGLVFDGSADFLNLPTGFNDFTQGVTAFVVTEPTTAASYARFFELSRGVSQSDVIFCRNSTGPDLLYDTIVSGFGETRAIASGPVDLNVRQIFEVSQATTGAVTFYENGASVGTGAATLPDKATRIQNYIAKGVYNDPLFAGRIAEVLIYNRTLTPSERDAVETYLRTRNNVQTTTAAAPTFTPNGGTFVNTTSFTLGTTTAGATIRYTTDGTDPTSTSTAYSSAVTLTSSKLVKARTFAAGFNPSTITSALFAVGDAAGTGDGAKAEYFASVDFTGNSLVRKEPVIDLDFGSGSPDVSIPSDNFSSRFTGTLRTRFSENFTFYTLSDDGAQLWVDLNHNGTFEANELIINDPGPHAATEAASAPVALTKGVDYMFKLEHHETTGVASIRLSWSSFSVAKQVIPQAQLTSGLASEVVLTPTFSPAPGTYAAGLQVMLATGTGGATIRYSTDGSDPTSTTGTLYSSPIAITGPTTIKARGFKTGAQTSGLAQGSFAVDTDFPVITGVTFRGTALANGASIGGSGLLGLTATDASGIAKAEFSVKPVGGTDTLIGTDVTSSNGLQTQWNNDTLADGDYVLTFAAYDPYGQKSTLARTIHLSLAARPPDLQVADTVKVLPATLHSGDTVTVSWTDQNTGASAATTGWSDRIRVFRPSNNAVLLDTLSFHDPASEGTLAAGGSLSRQATFKLPDGPSGAGAFRVEITVDGSNNVAEFNTAGTGETNNTSGVNFTPVLGAYPDLEVKNLVVSPVTIQSGATVTVRWNAQNTGTASIGDAFADRLVVRNASNNETLSDQTVGGEITGVLAAGGKRARQAIVTLPQGSRGSGSLVFTVTTDVTNIVAEYNAADTGETNNAATATVHSSLAPAADLIVTSITAPAQAVPGQSIDVTYTVKNQGTANAPAGWTDQILLSDDAQLGGDRAIGTLIATTALAAGQSVDRHATVTLPNLAGGPQYVGVIANVGGDTFEGDLTNNGAIDPTPTNIATVLAVKLDRPSIVENGGSMNGTITRNGSLTAALSVTLQATPSGLLTVPPTVTISAGQASATFAITPIDDTLVNGTRTGTITAHASGYTDGAAMLTVTDDDVPMVFVTVSPATVIESATNPAATGTVRRNGDTTSALTVALLSSSASTASTPATIVIPAGQASATFPITVYDDNVLTGTRTVRFTASAGGLATNSANLDVTDDDIPNLGLLLLPNGVTENAANPAATGRLTRNVAPANDLIINLASSNTAAALVPAQITLPAGKTTVDFPISVVDNATTNGTRNVTISATETDSVLHSPIALQTVSAVLKVYDDEGATLVLSASAGALKTGTTLMGTVSRKPGTSGAVTVNLTSDQPKVTVPSSVMIANGQSMVNFTITAASGVTTPLNATITATAAGFNSAALGVAVTTGDLPDLVAEQVAASATSGAGGSTVNVNWMVSNNGSVPATGAWTDRIFLSTNPQTVGGTPVATVNASGPLAKGTGYTRTAAITLPQAPGRYYVALQTDSQNDLVEGSESNNSLVAAQPIDVGAAYTVTVATDAPVYPSGTRVLFHGVATKAGGGGVAGNVPVSVRVLMGGTRRVYTGLTNADGTYIIGFPSLASEAGHYTVAAAQPDVTADTVQASFDLIGITANPATLDLRLGVNQTVSGDIPLTNISAVSVTGMSATLIGSSSSGVLPANITGSLVPPVGLTAGQTGPLHYSLRVTSDVITVAKVLFHVTSANGAALDIPINISVIPIGSQLVPNPGVLSRGMLRGAQTLVECVLTNLGAAPSGDLTVQLPTNFPWLTLSSPATIPSLAPGAAAKIVLQLLPAANLPLNLYSGTIVVSAAQSGTSIPFQFRAISSAVGDVKVSVLDDYTYYTPGAPKVPNATVKLRDPFDQSIVVAQGVTDATGTVLLPALPEGSYVLEASANKHSTYRNGFKVVPGVANEASVFLDRQTVTYTWQVVPTEVPDRYEIKLVATFEVDVPIPEVIMDITPSTTIPDLQPGESTQVNINLTNYGLIAANQVAITVPGLESGFQFLPLVSMLDKIDAKSSVSVPMIVRRPVAGTVSAALKNPARFAGGGGAGGGGADCTAFCFAIYSYDCGDDHKYHQTGQPLVFSGEVCPGAGAGGFIPVTAGPAGPGGMIIFGPGVTTDDDCDPCQQAFAGAAGDCVIGFLPLGPAFACGKSALGCATPKNSPPHAVYSCLRAVLDCAALVGSATPAGPGLAALDCLEGAANAAAKCAESSGDDDEGDEGAGAAPAGVPSPRRAKVTRTTRTVASYQVARTAAGALQVAATTGTSPQSVSLTLLNERLARLSDEIDSIAYFFGDRAWLAFRDGKRNQTWMTALTAAMLDTSDGSDTITANERTALLALPLPDGITTDQANTLMDRLNRTLDYYLKGIFNLAQVPAGQSTDFIALDVANAKATRAQQDYDLSQAEGFDSPSLGVLDAVQKIRSLPPKKTQGVCARVKIEIDQQAILTRQAFSGTLIVTNGNQSSPIQDVAVVLDIRDANGQSANDQFFIQGPDVSGLVSVAGHGQLAAGATGRLQYTFIPKTTAAPLAPTVYNFAGTLQYNDGGQQVSLPMVPSPVTVYPDAKLTLKYFQQRDVYADDPFTPQIEPSEPFALGLIVTNSGHGSAKQFSIISAQPKIIDNQKGLLIDFKIIGTEVGDQQVTPSLTVNLGDIDPGESQVARFLLTSTLQGKFIDYQATFEHANDLGGQETSLIDSVEIHELIHVVRDDRAGADDLPDFLTNEVLDTNSIPDTLYLSNGSVAPVNPATNVVTAIGTMQGTVTCTQPTGWSYFQVTDPGAGFKLAKVVRSDGKVLRVDDNVWQTDRSFPGSQTGATHENLLHLLDFNGTGSYTLYYIQAPDPNFLTAPVQIVTLGPVTPAVRTTPIDTIDITFSRPIDPATFTPADVTISLNDGADLLGGHATITALGEASYRIGNLAAYNAGEGTYVLKVNANTIADVTGQAGQGSASAVFAISTSHLAVLSAGNFAGSSLRGPVPSIDVVFTRAVDPTSFSMADVSLKLNGGAELLGSGVSITQTAPTTFRIGGLSTLTTTAGDYAFTVFTTGVKDADGNTGVGRITEHFTIDPTGPTIASLDDVVPNPRNSAVSSLDLVFSKPIADGTFKASALTLTRAGKKVTLGTTQIIELDSTHYRLAGLTEATGLAGAYKLDVSAAGVTDLLGNPGSGTVTKTWTLSTTRPAAPTGLAITPDHGSSATDHMTNTGVITITGSAKSGTRARATDETTGTVLGETPIAKGKFSLPVVFTLAGLHDVTLRAIDDPGNLSAGTPLRIFIDLTAPTVSLSAVSPATRSTPVVSMEVTFSETLKTGSFKIAGVTLKRDGTVVPLKGVTIAAASGGYYVLNGLGALTDKAGVYDLAVDATAVQDIAGNAGLGSATATWRRLDGKTTPHYDALVGSYTGLVEAPEPTHATSGIATISLTKTGAFTAVSTYGGIKYSYRGKLDDEGKWHGVAGKGATALSISLALAAQDTSEVFIGTYSGAAGQTGFVADRLVNTTAQKALAGKYVLVLAAPTTALPGVPTGDGFGVATITTKGKLTATGELPDGTKFSQSTPLAGDDQWPFYVALDRGKSSIVAPVFFRETDGVSDLDGTVDWFRSARVAKLFPGAFSTALPLVGSAYIPPKTGQPAFDFGTPNQTANLVLSNGGLATPLTLPFSFTTKGLAVFTTPGTFAPKLSLTLATGRLAGSIKLAPDKTATAFRGVVFPKQSGGSGYFLRLPDGGTVELQPAP